MSGTAIEALGGSSLDQLLGEDFRQRFGLSRPGQFGMVCADVATHIERLEALGCTPFIHANMGAPGWTEQGERREVQVEMAMGYTGADQIELLGPGQGTRFYLDDIDPEGSLRLHHVCCFENNLAELKQRLPAAGFPLYLEGGINIGLLSTYFAYFDTRETLGFWLEIAQYRLLGRHQPPTEAFISRLARLQRRFS